MPAAAAELPAPERIIDCHIHFYDPWRPGYSGLGSSPGPLQRVCLSEQCRALCGDEGVVGAVLVECSDALEDNQYLLDLSDTDDFIVGLVGHVAPGPGFAAGIDRFASHPRFVGVRPSPPRTSAECSVEELRHLRDSGLALDQMGGPPDRVQAFLSKLEHVPGLRVILNHMGVPGVAPGVAAQPSADWVAAVQLAASVDTVYMKVSDVLGPGLHGEAPPTLEHYREKTPTGAFASAQPAAQLRCCGASRYNISLFMINFVVPGLCACVPVFRPALGRTVGGIRGGAADLRLELACL